MIDVLAWLAGTALLAPLSRGFTLTPRLGAFVVRAAAGLRQDTILLNFAVELLERELEGVSWINFNLTHGLYQRDLRSLDRPAP